MEQIQKRSQSQTQRYMWEIVLSQTKINNNSETCAICRGGLRDECVECQANNYNNVNEYREQIQKIWLILLMCQKRKEALLSLLPIQVVALIYSYVVGYIETYNNCPSVTLEGCHHTYHRHCWTRWTNRRPNCPLDNQITSILSEDYLLVKTKYATLKGCCLSTKQYDEILRVRHLHERLDAQIVRLLKPRTRRGGYTVDQIYGIVESRDLSHVQEVLNDLVKREYVIYNSEENRYEYNP